MTTHLLVTGGTGFIGSHLAESALRQGHQVSVLGLTDIESDACNANRLEKQGAKIFAGSIIDKTLCQRAMSGVTHVFHLAVAMREGGLSDAEFQSVNLQGTQQILDIAVECGLQRFVYCGTIGIFGHRFDGVYNENSPKAPGNIYEETKLAAEKVALDYCATKNLPVVVLRPADVYGPRDQRLKKLFDGIAKKRFPLFGKGAGRRHMVHVDDVVSAFETACNAENAIGETMIIAGPEVCTLRQLIDRISIELGQSRFGLQLPLKPALLLAGVVEDVCRRVGVSPPIYRRRMDFYTSDSAFDISHAKRVMDWEPTVSLRLGLRKVCRSYRNNNAE